jgi:hypothetical protein
MEEICSAEIKCVFNVYFPKIRKGMFLQIIEIRL